MASMNFESVGFWFQAVEGVSGVRVSVNEGCATAEVITRSFVYQGLFCKLVFKIFVIGCSKIGFNARHGCKGLK